jgi:hypothetical protein
MVVLPAKLAVICVVNFATKVAEIGAAKEFKQMSCQNSRQKLQQGSRGKGHGMADLCCGMADLCWGTCLEKTIKHWESSTCM